MPEYQISNHAVILIDGNRHTMVRFAHDGILQIRSNLTGDFQELETLVVIRKSEPRWDRCVEHGNGLTLEHGGIRAEISLEPLCVRVYRSDGSMCFATADTALCRREGRYLTTRYRLFDGEAVYGLGQGSNNRLNLRGKRRELWNQWDAFTCCGSGGMPFVYSSGGYGLLLNTSWATRFYVGGSEPTPKTVHARPAPPWEGEPDPPVSPDETLIVTNGAELDLFLLCGPGYPAVIGGYRLLTGAPPMPPRWAMEFIQSRFGYMSQEELLYVAQEFVRRDIPCSAFMLDINVYKRLGDLVLDPVNWPSVSETIRVLNQLGKQLISGQHPFIDEQSHNYDEFAEVGCLISWKPPEEFTGLTGWYGHAFDFSHPKGRRLWWEKIAKQFADGVRGYWTDMGELEIYPEDASPQYMGPREKMQNLYTLTWARTLYEGQRSCSDERLFMVQRSLYAGIQRYGVCNWSGDVDSSFQVLDDHVVIGQQVCLSGQVWWCTDVGGFQDNEGYYDPELFVRWLQWGAFCPILRVHGQRDNEPWSYGAYYEPIIADLIRLRYSLMPYIYTYARAATDTGCSIMRAMVIAFPDDARAVGQDHQFLFGDSILVAPVTQKGQRRRELYLPEGLWYAMDGGEAVAGGQVITADAPLNRIPLYVKAGSILPRARVDGQKLPHPDDVELHVYTGSDGSFSLYNDDGTYAYERGEYVTTEITYQDMERTLVIGPMQGEYRGMKRRRRLSVFFFGLERATAVRMNGRLLDSRVDPRTGALTVELGQAAAEETVVLTLHEDAVKAFVFAAAAADWTVDLQPYPDRCLVNLHNTRRKITPQDLDAVRYLPPPGWTADPDLPIYSEGSTLTLAFQCMDAPHTANGFLALASPVSLTIPLGTGWATWWRVAGVYEAGVDGFHQVFLPERRLEISPEFLETGVEIKKSSNLWFSGFVDLKKAFHIQTGQSDYEELCHKTAYASCMVEALEEMDGYLEVMADDRLKIWLNGDMVALADETFTQAFTYRVHLKQGENQIFLKCSQRIPHLWKETSARPWGFNLRILDIGRAVSERLRYSMGAL